MNYLLLSGYKIYYSRKQKPKNSLVNEFFGLETLYQKKGINITIFHCFKNCEQFFLQIPYPCVSKNTITSALLGQVG